MNNNLAVPDGGAWLVDRFAPSRGIGPAAVETREGSGLDLAALLRIITSWRWLILGAVGLGIVAAIIVTLLTTPTYRSWVTLEVNPPTVEIMDEQQRPLPAECAQTLGPRVADVDTNARIGRDCVAFGDQPHRQFGRIATARSGAPVPPAIFIGSATMKAPRGGRRSSAVRFSKAGRFAS